MRRQGECPMPKTWEQVRAERLARMTPEERERFERKVETFRKAFGASAEPGVQGSSPREDIGGVQP